MRLGQLSRKLEVKPSTIVEILKEKYNIDLSLHPNSKIPDELIEDISHFFCSKKQNENIISNNNTTQSNNIVKKTSEKSIITTSNSLMENPSLEKIKQKEKSEITNEWENFEFISDDIKADAETIKKPEIQLEGLTIVGKIDLPEPKIKIKDKKNPLEKKSSNLSSEKKKKTKKRRPKKFSIEESEEYKKKKKQELHLQKLKDKQSKNKKAHYTKILKEQQKKTDIKNRKKRKKENTKSIDKVSMKKELLNPKPKTLWGKLKKWLNDS